MSEVTLTDFLLARIAEDERCATAAAGDGAGVWTKGSYPPEIEGDDGMKIYDEGGHTKADSKHIIRWDPARALAECAAKRRIVEMSAPDLLGILQALASVYADHPDYRAEWGVK